jgi:DNA-3-methyladenine glycosylase II
MTASAATALAKKKAKPYPFNHLAAVRHLRRCDAKFEDLISRVGRFRMEMDTHPNPYEALMEAIVYQQLNGKAAETIFKRFAALAGEPLTPEGLLKLSDEQMRGAGLSKQKAAYLKDLAAKTSSGLVDFARLPELPDAEVVEHLTQVKGIGVWTAQMFLMFTLKRENVLPTGDFGVRMAMHKHYLDGRPSKTAKKSAKARKGRKRKIKLPSPEQMEKVARRWEPYRSVACWYLWKSLDTKTL